MRNAGLGKTSEQWRQEVQEERSKAEQWEKRFHDTCVRESILKKSLVESQNEKEMLRARVEELEMTLHQSHSRNSAVELKASLNRIEDLRGKIEELEIELQNRELQIQLIKSDNEHWKELLHRSQNQVRNRDRIMGEAVAQIREVAEHLQTLAVQADVLSVKYELESDRGRELARLLKRVKTLGIRARP
ncbi:tropomyosin-1-like [Gossypium arboreum]|uniref:tropomyosin-1-like n=1 Tax=Gossypium arboreum TaxID=29729 RepID=UPI000819701D|nr:tropomyosin-1-like [Gossypium arboreum]